MKASEINEFILNNLITYQPIQIVSNDEKIIYGFFEFQENSDELAKENKWCFVNNNNSPQYHITKDKSLIDILDGFEIKTIKNNSEVYVDYFKQKLHEAMENYND